MTGDDLKKIITESGYTMASAARLLDMTPQHLNQALSVADVKSGLLEKISAAMGITIAALYGETPAADGTGEHSELIASLRETISAQRETIEYQKEIIETLRMGGIALPVKDTGTVYSHSQK